MATTYVSIPYTDLVKLQKDSADKDAVINLLKTEYPDTTCQIISIKAILGVVENEESEDEDTTDTTPSDSTEETPGGE